MIRHHKAGLLRDVLDAFVEMEMVEKLRHFVQTLRGMAVVSGGDFWRLGEVLDEGEDLGTDL